MSLPEPKLCVDCRWCQKLPQTRMCAHVANEQISLVDGVTRSYATIEFCRTSMGHCTESGIHWERKL